MMFSVAREIIPGNGDFIASVDVFLCDMWLLKPTENETNRCRHGNVID